MKGEIKELEEVNAHPATGFLYSNSGPVEFPFSVPTGLAHRFHYQLDFEPLFMINGGGAVAPKVV